MNNSIKLKDISCADKYGMVCSLVCSVGLCFNGQGHFKSLLFLLMSPIASKHWAFTLTKVSAFKVATILKRCFSYEANQRLPYWNCVVSQAMFILTDVILSNSKLAGRRKTCHWLGNSSRGQQNLFSKWLSTYYLQCYHFGVQLKIVCLAQNSMAQKQPWPRVVVKKNSSDAIWTKSLGRMASQKCCLAAEYCLKWWQRCLNFGLLWSWGKPAL